MDHNFYMNLAIEQAKKAYKKGDVPVGCIIVKDNKIISKSYNQKENKNIALYHAEMLAILKACKKLKTWHLENCILYTTLEPCIMCCGAILQSRIKLVVCGTKNINLSGKDYIQNVQIINLNRKECSDLLKNFFKLRRK